MKELDVETAFEAARALIPQPKIKLKSTTTEREQKITWKHIVEVLKEQLGAREQDLEVMKSSLVIGDYASRAAFDRLNDHMGPIKAEGAAQDGEWTFSSLAKLYQKEYFHGYLTNTEAIIRLSNLPAGSWLLRFSVRSSKSFAISMMGEEGVDHWLISYDEESHQYGIAGEVEQFSTIYKVVEHYEKHSPPGYSDTLGEVAFSLEGKVIVTNKKLGEGNYGQVYEAIWKRETGEQKVAAKCMNVDPEKIKQMNQDDEPQSIAFEEKIEREVDIIKKLDHDNIVTFYGMVMIGAQYIITEFMNSGNLLQYLQQKNKNNTLPSDLIRLAKDAARGMDYLSSQKIVHRDLAARNLLVNVGEDGVPIVKVSDFGLSRVTESYYVKSGNSGDPVYWAAPEAFKTQPGNSPFKGKVSTRSDRWSFGVVLFEIFNLGRKVPYEGKDILEIKLLMADFKPMFEYLNVEDAPVKINELVKDLLQYYSHSRPDFLNILARLNEAEKELNEKPQLNVWQQIQLPHPHIEKISYDEEDGEVSDLRENEGTKR
eukprot:TRINITY_DN1994_c0_g2_i1.p1 TRINITY_DN1994_c0_g2~~TRINITY_DN1994_c0_g2_i1.p1  ORF type:complete len:632 (+),score=152.32 TRINITY_DN1994_c0_g2_i1:279-1898(+)